MSKLEENNSGGTESSTQEKSESVEIKDIPELKKEDVDIRSSFQKEFERLQNHINEKEKSLEEKEKNLVEKEKSLEEKEKSLEEKEKDLEQKIKEIVNIIGIDKIT